MPDAHDDNDDSVEAYDGSASTSKKVKKEKKSKRKRDEEGFPIELLEAAKKGGDEARAQLLEKMVDEYYKLDYEDKVSLSSPSIIGDALAESMWTRSILSDW